MLPEVSEPPCLTLCLAPTGTYPVLVAARDAGLSVGTEVWFDWTEPPRDCITRAAVSRFQNGQVLCLCDDGKERVLAASVLDARARLAEVQLAFSRAVR